MATGIVVLGPCPRLLRDLLRAVLAQRSTLRVVDAPPPPDANLPVLAQVLVAEPDHALEVARTAAAEAARAGGAEVPVVVVSPDGRWAGRFSGGRLVAMGEVSADDLLRLVGDGD